MGIGEERTPFWGGAAAGRKSSGGLTGWFMLRKRIILRAAGSRPNGDGARKTRTRDRPRAVPAPEANAELQANIDKRRLIMHANAKSKSEKFPPPHQDGALGYPLGCSNHMEPTFEPPDPSSFSTVFPYDKTAVPTWSGPLVDPPGGNQKRKHKSGRSSKQPSTARAR
ncbi:unnamed protein product [Triticum turgidum subsp. durum]|uniref:Serine/threonine-protein kinase n=1 Tax=Triticum turgidum subsp. durum TaxID=4567 RepID=A0A9R1RIC5_TRITD|nr:unnamed protein product [Triticum turgidum subsp. durum]